VQQSQNCLVFIIQLVCSNWKPTVSRGLSERYQYSISPYKSKMKSFSLLWNHMYGTSKYGHLDVCTSVMYHPSPPIMKSTDVENCAPCN